MMVNPFLKVTIWSFMLCLVALFFVFFFLTRKSKRSAPLKPKSLLKIISISVVFLVALGSGSYFLINLALRYDNTPVITTLTVPGFPVTGTQPTGEIVVQALRSLYSTPADRLVTSSLLVLIVLMAFAAFHNIARGKQIDRAKTEFVSLASHQLRTPLTTISWYTEMMLGGEVGVVNVAQKKYLKEIYQGNQRMVELVDTLLNVSRIELGTFLSEPQMTDIIALAHSVLHEQKLTIKKKQLIITENFSENVPSFLIDPKLLRMVFQNLLANAVEYTPVGGKIELTISLDDKKTVLIKISDTGYGIPKNQQNQIFTRLFRADNVREKEIVGTGLGLYIVKSIIENFGGKIWFSSPGELATAVESPENPGTTFHVTFPMAGANNQAHAT